MVLKHQVSVLKVALCGLQLATLCAALVVPKRVSGFDQLVLRLRDDPQASTSVVRLDDVVEIVAGSVTSLDKLRELPLGPAPQDGGVQTWHQMDVLQHLELRGVQPNHVRWTGRESTKLRGVQETLSTDPAATTPAFTDQRLVDSAAANVVLAIKEHLNLRSGSRTDWRVKVQIPVQHARLMQSRSQVASISGGEEPWTGKQMFVFQIKSQGKLVSVKVEANVKLPPMIVVATGPLRRDAILTEDMLDFAPMPPKSEEQRFFTEIQELVGKQLRKSVSTRQAIRDDLVGQPIVVHRQDLVEVESVSGAIVVRTPGKSLGSGAIGDAIDVELAGRRKLLATVVGPGKVRIAAVSVTSKSK